VIYLYSDGACSGNHLKNSGGPGGWCYLTVLPCKTTATNSGGEDNTTNNRMELMAVVRGLENLYGDITVVSDSAYVVNAINKKWMEGWKSNNWKKSGSSEAVSNLDLWQELDELLAENSRSVTFQWVKGHSNHKENDYCDKISRQIARKRWDEMKHENNA
jgi:ribonuclease HI